MDFRNEDLRILELRGFIFRNEELRILGLREIRIIVPLGTIHTNDGFLTRRNKEWV